MNRREIPPRTRRSSRVCAAAFALSCTCASAPTFALAQPAQPAPSASTKSEARDRFDRGLALFNDGDNAGALAEFKRAYELIPNPLVLYNIGLVYAAMGRPVEAVDALDKVLAAPGAMSQEKVERGKRTRAEQAQRIAEVSITTNVPATVEVDNVEVGKTPLAGPLKIAGGVHIVGAIAAGYAPSRKEVTVAGGEKAEANLELVQMQGRAAHVTVKTHLPAADLFVDGQAAGKTPLPQSITVAPGTHAIELRRTGYVTARQDLTLGEGAQAEVALEPEEDRSALAGSGGGLLALDISESQSVVTIDGKPRGPYTASVRLAPGLHRVLVERGGFEPLERDVSVDAGRTTTVRVALDPTPETRAAYVSRATSQRTWGIVALTTGVVVAGGAVGFLVWNAGQKSSAQSDFNAAESNVTNRVGICDSRTTQFDAGACNQPVTDAQSRIDSANARNVYGYVGLGVGAVAVGIGAYLLLSHDDPHRYDRPSTEGSARRAIVPIAWGEPRGGGAGLAGAF